MMFCKFLSMASNNQAAYKKKTSRSRINIVLHGKSTLFRLYNNIPKEVESFAQVERAEKSRG